MPILGLSGLSMFESRFNTQIYAHFGGRLYILAQLCIIHIVLLFMFMVFHVAEAREPWGNSILPPFPTLSPSPTSSPSPSSSPTATATFQYGCRRCLVATPPWGAAGAVVIVFFSLFAVNDLTIFDFTAFSFLYILIKNKKTNKNISTRS